MRRKTVVALVATFLFTIPFWASHQIRYVNGENIITQEANFFETIEDLPDASKPHYKFTGWFDGDNKVEEISNTLLPRTLEAKFKPEMYPINYDLDGAEDPETLQYIYHYGDTVELPELSKENYDFIGYELNGKTVKGVSPSDYGPLNFKAVFEPKTFQITYCPDEGELSSDEPSSYVYGSPVKLPEPTRKGYSFIGWFLDEELSERLVFDEETSGDLVLYAGYKKIPSVERNLSKPYIVCGSYAASLIGHSDPNNDIVNAIVDGPGAWHDYLAGKEYIADHNYQGASAFTYNDTLSIVRTDGTVENYTKVSSMTKLWQPGMDPADDCAAVSGSLVTQTCVGANIEIDGWNKN